MQDAASQPIGTSESADSAGMLRRFGIGAHSVVGLMARLQCGAVCSRRMTFTDRKPKSVAIVIHYPKH